MHGLRVVLCALAFAVVATAEPPGADEIVVPHSDGVTGLCEPFDCSTRIQQVFNASLFPSKMKIEAIELFNNSAQSAEGFAEPASYEVYLSTTAASWLTITPDMDANLGDDHRLVAQFTIADFDTFFTGAFRIPLSAPFGFNPRKGNLLLEIRKDQTANYGDGTIYVDGRTNAPGVALVTDQFGVQSGVGMSVGLVGKFAGPFRQDVAQ
jgi:hypothetical protein